MSEKPTTTVPEPRRGSLVKAEINSCDVWGITTGAPSRGKVKMKVMEVVSPKGGEPPRAHRPGRTSEVKLEHLTLVKPPNRKPPRGNQTSFAIHLHQGAFRRIVRLTGSGPPTPVKIVDVAAEYVGDGRREPERDYTADFFVDEDGMTKA